MQVMNLADLLKLSDAELREIMLQSIGAKDYNQLFVYLRAFDCFEVSDIQERQIIWDARCVRLQFLANIYPVLAPFVQVHYNELDALVQKYDGWQLNFWGVMRELCILYLMSLGCACGKPYNIDYFEEDYTHVKCALYQKWAWAHLPVAMRRSYGIME